MAEDCPGRPDQDRPQDALERLTVAEAAERLGITQDAVRKRMARGTIRHAREDGRLYVYLDAFERMPKPVRDDGQHGPSKTAQDDGQDRYVRSLEDQIQFLRWELERKDAILLRLAERIPELEPSPSPEAPLEERESSTEAVPEPAGGEGREEPGDREEDVRRSWWQRMFGG